MFIIKCHNIVKKSYQDANFCYKKSQPCKKIHENVNLYYKKSKSSEEK